MCRRLQISGASVPGSGVNLHQRETPRLIARANSQEVVIAFWKGYRNIHFLLPFLKGISQAFNQLSISTCLAFSLAGQFVVVENALTHRCVSNCTGSQKTFPEREEGEVGKWDYWVGKSGEGSKKRILRDRPAWRVTQASSMWFGSSWKPNPCKSVSANRSVQSHEDKIISTSGNMVAVSQMKNLCQLTCFLFSYLGKFQRIWA